MKLIRDIAVSERPREKLEARGAAALTDVELLAVLLGSGSKGSEVLALSQDLLRILDTRNGDLSVADLKVTRGIGSAKACLITAAIEFARRRIRPHQTKVRSSKDVVPLIRHYTERKQEHFICISLNGAHEVIATRVVTVGLVNSAQVHPREVFAEPIVDRACAVIVAHNHPSGDCEPSPEDLEITRVLREAGTILGIKLLDHIIFSSNGHYSIQDRKFVPSISNDAN